MNIRDHANQIVKAAEARAKADALELGIGQSIIPEHRHIKALVVVKLFENQKISIKWYLNDRETHRNRIAKLIKKIERYKKGPRSI